jgi:hypothetical protein
MHNWGGDEYKAEEEEEDNYEEEEESKSRPKKSLLDILKERDDLAGYKQLDEDCELVGATVDEDFDAELNSFAAKTAAEEEEDVSDDGDENR